MSNQRQNINSMAVWSFFAAQFYLLKVMGNPRWEMKPSTRAEREFQKMWCIGGGGMRCWRGTGGGVGCRGKVNGFREWLLWVSLEDSVTENWSKGSYSAHNLPGWELIAFFLWWSQLPSSHPGTPPLHVRRWRALLWTWAGLPLFRLILLLPSQQSPGWVSSVIVVRSYNQFQISTGSASFMECSSWENNNKDLPSLLYFGLIHCFSHEKAVYVIGPFTVLTGLAYHSNCGAHLLQCQQNAGEAENNRHISKGIQMHFLWCLSSVFNSVQEMTSLNKYAFPRPC